MDGTHACLKWLGIPKCLICIEDNKPAAIDLMQRKTEEDPGIGVCVLESRYPQGAQNILIHNATGRTVPRGARHTSVGVMMLNVTTVSSIGKFLKTGMPLVNKRLTVAGDAVAHPKKSGGTYWNPHCRCAGLLRNPGGATQGHRGRPHDGQRPDGCELPHYPAEQRPACLRRKVRLAANAENCIRCGRCINSCPVGLSPLDIRDAYLRYDTQALDKLMADLCIGCGTCSYVCPAKRPLTQMVGLAKRYLNSHQKGGKSWWKCIPVIWWSHPCPMCAHH